MGDRIPVVEPRKPSKSRKYNATRLSESKSKKLKAEVKLALAEKEPSVPTALFPLFPSATTNSGLLRPFSKLLVLDGQRPGAALPPSTRRLRRLRHQFGRPRRISLLPVFRRHAAEPERRPAAPQPPHPPHHRLAGGRPPRYHPFRRGNNDDQARGRPLDPRHWPSPSSDATRRNRSGGLLPSAPAPTPPPLSGGAAPPVSSVPSRTLPSSSPAPPAPRGKWLSCRAHPPSGRCRSTPPRTYPAGCCRSTPPRSPSVRALLLDAAPHTLGRGAAARRRLAHPRSDCCRSTTPRTTSVERCSLMPPCTP
jgi:hypothetical protein